MHVFTTAQVSVPAIPQLVAIAIIVGIDSDFQIKPFIFCKRSTYKYTPDSILYSAKELISLRQDRPFGSTRFRRAAWGIAKTRSKSRSRSFSLKPGVGVYYRSQFSLYSQE